MGLSIKNAEIELMVRELAKRRGVGVSGAIRLAVSNELAKDPPPKKDVAAINAAVREIQQRWAQFPPISMAEFDDWMYDENGLPR